MLIYLYIHCNIPLGHTLFDNQDRIFHAEVALFPQGGLGIDLPTMVINDEEVRVLARRQPDFYKPGLSVLR